MIESQIRAMFAQIADGEPASSRVDAQQAGRRGRARLRWRRAGVAGTSVLVVAVAALALGVGPVRLGSGPPAGPAAPRQFSPLVPYASFGWLPAGVSPGSGGIQPTEVYMDAGPSGNPEWSLDVYARGQCHLTGSAKGLQCPNVPSGTVTAPINGRAPDVARHQAYWAGGTGLIWEYARGGWAWLIMPGLNASMPRHNPATSREAFTIAGHVRFGAATPLVFPAQLNGLPSQWQLHNISYYVPDGGRVAAEQYMLTTGHSRFDPHVGDQGVWTDAPYIIVHPAPAHGSCSPHDPSSQNTSEIINGYRVVVKRSHLGGLPVQELCGAHADGLWFDIQVFGAHPSIDVATLFKDHMRLLGTSPANWTTSPIG